MRASVRQGELHHTCNHSDCCSRPSLLLRGIRHVQSLRSRGLQARAIAQIGLQTFRRVQSLRSIVGLPARVTAQVELRAFRRVHHLD